MPPRHATLPARPPQAGSADDARTARRCSVLLPLPLDGAYDYLAAGDAPLPPGTFVSVPLGRRVVPGVVWDAAEGEGVATERLRRIDGVLDAPPLRGELRRFIDWVASYTMTPPGAVLRMAMSVSEALTPPRPVVACALAEAGAAALRGDGAADRRLTPSRWRVLQAIAGGPPLPLAELARAAGCGVGVVRGLLEAGLLSTVAMPARTSPQPPDWRRAGPLLAPEQAAAARDLQDKVRSGGFSVTVLDGVTGSGKTEVYFAAVAEALARGVQVLVLLPEIALGAQFLGRFIARFGAAPSEWHSDLTHAERRHAWRDVAEGRARVVVGARSALFLPFAELGLVIVDEEHDASFKQEEGVIYHARDMAVVRGSLARIPVVLVSATPALETMVNVEQQRYHRLRLPGRHAGAALPAVRTIDLRRHPPERQRFLAPPLVAAIEETLAAGEQALLFLNRRGYAPLTLCRACGHRMECPNCTAWLIEHRFHGRLQCHHCGHAEALPRHCPACAAPGAFAACGPGVERLAEEVAARFPAARRAVMASDTLTGPRAAAMMVRAMAAHEIDILIGTQIVAKGHHFPMLTLVGVVDADLGLAGGDLRAAERTFQLLHQVAGRAGRAARPGVVHLQTFIPDHPVIRALVSGERDRFLAEEAAAREKYAMPPFGRLAALIISGPDGDTADAVAAAFARAAPQMPGIDVLGPAPAPLAILRSRHRRRFLVKARRNIAPQPVLRAWLARVKLPSTVRVQIDIDPYSFL
ncbi:MAG: primosomal protein N' [Alphaproteobacteria bacterium]|nr:primosomal protein N' [Alphaproteobacteria bacterium]